ncbi:MAG: hypothetical protein DWQ31_05660 [Planctomycetota bacterium]|nr:MAG: hypothetical protein DWQ31_05660 [Planctomycetota bacterium]REK17358.1 MAG: hypothetical protein DWQ42_22500 [Planctomycetota bacterium]REK46033.1 MAG: hypothetical protein DWQ46_07670 [Planctomycetota bacterium]
MGFEDLAEPGLEVETAKFSESTCEVAAGREGDRFNPAEGVAVVAYFNGDAVRDGNGRIQVNGDHVIETLFLLGKPLA